MKQATRRLAGKLDRLPAAVLEQMAGVFDRLKGEIPGGCQERGADGRVTVGNGDLIVRTGLMLSLLDHGQIRGVADAIETAILDGVFDRGQFPRNAVDVLRFKHLSNLPAQRERDRCRYRFPAE